MRSTKKNKEISVIGTSLSLGLNPFSNETKRSVASRKDFSYLLKVFKFNILKFYSSFTLV